MARGRNTTLSGAGIVGGSGDGRRCVAKGWEEPRGQAPDRHPWQPPVRIAVRFPVFRLFRIAVPRDSAGRTVSKVGASPPPPLRSRQRRRGAPSSRSQAPAPPLCPPRTFLCDVVANGAKWRTAVGPCCPRPCLPAGGRRHRAAIPLTTLPRPCISSLAKRRSPHRGPSPLPARTPPPTSRASPSPPAAARAVSARYSRWAARGP